MNATFLYELTTLINRYSQENASNTPDFILAQYLEGCLTVFTAAVHQRETWYGRDARPRSAEAACEKEEARWVQVTKLFQYGKQLPKSGSLKRRSKKTRRLSETNRSWSMLY